ncbi:hypothetical protein [Brumimicrobium oceani]|uniref:Uncharacterized protein n=1 Tax=Brumimicrobium oceani TaxID=2100725 RepID=A0A2U2XAF3_9FLAO|nr:hypothetical protein [Brumimicrobium oceani]PWH84774.1 hypothetical protein DIT68_12650 [Brumimicrobium oceani]
MKYLLIISLLVFFSCKKERTFHITAKNAATGEPYPGLSYEIQRSWSGAFENKYKSVGSGVLDANGEAFFTKRLHDNSSYSISVAPPPNTCYISDSDLHAGGDKNFDAAFEFAECAYLKLKIKNVNCESPNDEMSLYQGNQIGSFNYTQPWEHNGCTFWESNGYSNIPMGEQYYKWEVTRNNITTTYYDTIYLNAGEYRTYEINY